MSNAPDIFLSYNREDQERARQFATGFEQAGLSVWWDITLRSGDAYDEITENALKTARAVVVLWSKKSVVSRWVRAEATLADRNRTLVPAMIEPCDRPIMFELTQTAELSHWHGDERDPAWRAFLEDLLRFTGKNAAAPKSPALALAESAAQRPSILVLPFVNRSGDVEQEYFSDGVSEDIITDLGRISGLDVVSRNTAFAHKGKVATSTELAASLRISHILEGSVRKAGDRVRITAQLLDAKTDVAIWTDRFDRDLDDIFALQDEISDAVVAALRLTLLPGEKEAVERRDTASGEAYELFLQARQFERTGSERMKPIIMRFCEKATELDPGFARAWALLASTEAEMIQRGVPGHTVEQARIRAERAVELAPNLPETHVALAEVRLRAEMDMEGSATPTNEALELDPDNYEANLLAGYIAIGKHQFADAVAYFEKAIELDGEAYRPVGMVGQAYNALGDREGWSRSARRCLDLCERMLVHEPDHGGALGFMVSALADLGEHDRAREVAKRAQLLDPDNGRMLYNIACGMAAVDAEIALDLLEAIAPSVNDGWLNWMELDNSLDPLRELPRYRAFVETVRKRLEREARA